MFKSVSLINLYARKGRLLHHAVGCQRARAQYVGSLWRYNYTHDSTASGAAAMGRHQRQLHRSEHTDQLNILGANDALEADTNNHGCRGLGKPNKI